MNLLKLWKRFGHNMSAAIMREDYLLARESYYKRVKGKRIRAIVRKITLLTLLCFFGLFIGKIFSLSWVELFTEKLYKVPVQLFLFLQILGSIVVLYSFYLLSREVTSPLERGNGRLILAYGGTLILMGVFREFLTAF